MGSRSPVSSLPICRFPGRRKAKIGRHFSSLHIRSGFRQRDSELGHSELLRYDAATESACGGEIAWTGQPFANNSHWLSAISATANTVWHGCMSQSALRSSRSTDANSLRAQLDHEERQQGMRTMDRGRLIAMLAWFEKSALERKAR